MALASAHDSIAKLGLDWEKASASPWANADDYDEGIYLWDDEAWADYYAFQIDAETDIWIVDCEGIVLEADDSIAPGTPWHEVCLLGTEPECTRDYARDHAFRCRNAIPASRLQLAVFRGGRLVAQGE